jgi:hypothetical protein
MNYKHVAKAFPLIKVRRVDSVYKFFVCLKGQG